jgi:hypothetical protein
MTGARYVRLTVAVVLAAVFACSDDTTDPNTVNDFGATLNGANVKPNAVTTTATGTSTFGYSGGNITYDVDYTTLTATRAHIHTGGPAGPPGGIRVYLCGSTAAGDIAGTPACPATAGGSITGVATAANLNTGVTMDVVVNEMRGFGSYVNIHTAANPGGEIRGNIVGVF